LAGDNKKLTGRNYDLASFTVKCKCEINALDKCHTK
jgi:hypothetical protein